MYKHQGRMQRTDSITPKVYHAQISVVQAQNAGCAFIKYLGLQETIPVTP